MSGGNRSGRTQPPTGFLGRHVDVSAPATSTSREDPEEPKGAKPDPSVRTTVRRPALRAPGSPHVVHSRSSARRVAVREMQGGKGLLPNPPWPPPQLGKRE